MPHQLLINLTTNAAYAMAEQGGTLNVSLQEVHLSPHDIRQYHGIQAGPHVRLIVSDTGSGIPPDILDRIFDPLFPYYQLLGFDGAGGFK